MNLTLGFSPCPNDTFIFDAWVNGSLQSTPAEFGTEQYEHRSYLLPLALDDVPHDPVQQRGIAPNGFLKQPFKLFQLFFDQMVGELHAGDQGWDDRRSLPEPTGRPTFKIFIK